ncbi:MAG: hypothetical protein LBB11_00425 [Puniceicoccales bacterium]|jgi:hypothetical protein|nr:hypothetical protein [Puniceicoccales bacterium]
MNGSYSMEGDRNIARVIPTVTDRAVKDVPEVSEISICNEQWDSQSFHRREKMQAPKLKCARRCPFFFVGWLKNKRANFNSAKTVLAISGTIAVGMEQHTYGALEHRDAVPDLRFQRDLSSFPTQWFMNDHEAIALDAGIALAMGVAAASMTSAPSITLIESRNQTFKIAQSYGNFLDSMVDLIVKLELLDFKIISIINALTAFRLKPETSIGSLGGNLQGFKDLDLPKMSNKPPLWKRTIEYEQMCKAFAASLANKTQLINNIKALRNIIEESFGNKVHPMQQEFRVIQFIATGIDLLDQLDGLRKSQDQALSTQAQTLFNALNQKNILGDTQNLMFMKKLRTSAFFMEFKLEPIDNAICEKVIEILCSTQVSLNEIEKKVVVNAMKAKLEASRKANFGENSNTGVSGMRGRNRAHAGHQARFYSDRENPIQSFAASRCSDVDLRLLEQLPTASSNAERVNNFLKAMEDGKAFVQGKRMATQTANAQTLPQDRVEILNDPVAFFQNALEVTDINHERKVVIKKQLNLPDRDRAALKKELLSIEFTDEQKITRTINDLVQMNGERITSKPSLGSMIRDIGLRTLCSVSGTTTDIVAGLHAHIGEEGTKTLLQSLKIFVDAISKNPPAPKPTLSPEFKNLFLSIAMYMQSGQYHSAAEVLGGLYCAAITLFPEGNDPSDFNQIAPKFRKMWEAFKEHPEDFFPLSDEEKLKLSAQTPNIIKVLQNYHIELIEARKVTKVPQEGIMERHPSVPKALERKKSNETPPTRPKKILDDYKS